MILLKKVTVVILSIHVVGAVAVFVPSTQAPRFDSYGRQEAKMFIPGNPGPLGKGGEEVVSDCQYKWNLTHNAEYRNLEEALKDQEEGENCLYYYLFNRNYDSTQSFIAFHSYPPPEKNLTINVDEMIIRHVELVQGSTYQFNIYGDILLNWKDSRLVWDAEEWKIDYFPLQQAHKIWSPSIIDHSICSDAVSCLATLHDVEATSEGKVYARIQFRYASYCSIDYSGYPEEENDCCIFFTAFEPQMQVSFNVAAKAKQNMAKAVAVGIQSEWYNRERSVTALQAEHSAWVVTHRSVDVTYLGGIKSLEVLKVCVHAEKKMSTIAMALRVPVTIATLIMLVSPLFGDLRTQSYVKLLVLCLQTICFLYLCSIAPPNGFAGAKPRIYIFYEMVFFVTVVSILLTVGCMALSRVKRSIPPSHRLFLVAKLVNRVICCIEPEQSAAYQRYQEGENQAQSDAIDYTQDWRHIYLAVNNLFSGLFFSLFVLTSLISAIM